MSRIIKCEVRLNDANKNRNQTVNRTIFYQGLEKDDMKSLGLDLTEEGQKVPSGGKIFMTEEDAITHYNLNIVEIDDKDFLKESFDNGKILPENVHKVDILTGIISEPEPEPEPEPVEEKPRKPKGKRR